jgi:hypothetical protein
MAMQTARFMARMLSGYDRRSMQWPALPYAEWSDTCATLHMWTQIVGKIRMVKTPPVNHWWHVALYVTSCGLTTSPIPDRGRTFEITFDFHEHRLFIATSDAKHVDFALEPMAVAAFYDRVMRCLRELKIEADINTMPSEVPAPIRFEEDRAHKSYDAGAARRFWDALVCSDKVLKEFRSHFIGKVSPVHFFWGGFDLAVSRFSGRRAPKHPPVPGLPDSMVQEAYSHECSSVGWWPGGNGFDASYFAYTYPEPPGLSKARVRPAAAAWNDAMHEFILPYDAVRNASNPEQTLMEFCQSTYEAGADLAHWPRQELERAS